ncbi:uncharacterized protein LOC127257612 [Andrographis paniculata]|uniref:uncharacterized protein LOC127257612 n=1 Tax=Andrographis paniculata TaxID=175694 RepID=UPI0021E7C1A8|nr:uncharacterized protein LOC127257612 [Andrographis paniculata]
MPHSSRKGELILNLEIGKVERKLQKEAKQRKAAQVAKLAESLNHLRISSSSDSESEEPHKHLQEFNLVCSSMKPLSVTEEQIKLRAFPFSLKDAAKDWLYYLPLGSIDTWNDIKKKCLEKYFPASRTMIQRKEICGIKQQSGETFHEFWERFNKVIIKCPQHQIPPQLLIQDFYDGLSLMDKNIINAASGGALVNKTQAQAWDLIARMAENTQQFGSRDVGHTSKNSNGHSIQSMQQQLSELTSFVRKMVVKKSNPNVQVKACNICTNEGHPMDACPTLQEGYAMDVNAANYGANGPPVYNPYSNTYNPNWRDYPNLRYGNVQQSNALHPFGVTQKIQQPRFYGKQLP